MAAAAGGGLVLGPAGQICFGALLPHCSSPDLPTAVTDRQSTLRLRWCPVRSDRGRADGSPRVDDPHLHPCRRLTAWPRPWDLALDPSPPWSATSWASAHFAAHTFALKIAPGSRALVLIANEFVRRPSIANLCGRGKRVGNARQRTAPTRHLDNSPEVRPANGRLLRPARRSSIGRNFDFTW